MKKKLMLVAAAAVLLLVSGCLHVRYKDTVGSLTSVPLPKAWTYHRATMSDGTAELRLLDPDGQLWRYDAQGQLVKCGDEAFKPQGGSK